MTPTCHLYIDDSGSRKLDRSSDEQGGSKWFALGGVMVAAEDEEQVRAAHAAFCHKYNIKAPLHSYEIRQRINAFSWLNTLTAKKMDRFQSDLTDFLMSIPVTGFACVIDRQGYNERYKELYGERRWPLCKTAFSIVVERAAKHAQGQKRRMKVSFEQSSKKNDALIQGYFQELRRRGMPFDQGASAKYDPSPSHALMHTLYDCKVKKKSSPLIQIADLYLFPMCVGGYDPDNRPLAAMRQHGKIIDTMLAEEQIPKLGIKYSCFDPQKAKGEA